MIVMGKTERLMRNVAVVLFLVRGTLHIRQLVIEWRFLQRAAESGVQTSPFFAELQVLLVISFELRSVFCLELGSGSYYFGLVCH